MSKQIYRPKLIILIKGIYYFLEDFLRNPPAEQPAGPLAPQPQPTNNRIGLAKQNHVELEFNHNQLLLKLVGGFLLYIILNVYVYYIIYYI